MIATAVYTMAPYSRTSQEVLNALFHNGEPAAERPAPQHKQIFASLKGKEQAIKRLAKWVQRREGSHIAQRVALSDGAEPLQRQMLICLPEFSLLLDIIHAIEYLWKAGTALSGETDPYRAEWVEAQTLQLLSSRVEQVIQVLEDKAALLAPSIRQPSLCVSSPLTFAATNPTWITLNPCAVAGRIGTGVIEGTCHHLVKDRMELSGMRWSIPGAGALLALRAVNENGDWEDFHAFRRAQCHQELYDVPLKTLSLIQIECFEINSF